MDTFVRRGGHRTRDHETREAFSNRLRSTIAFTTDLFNLFCVVEITGRQQQALQHHCFDHRPYSIGTPSNIAAPREWPLQSGSRSRASCCATDHMHPRRGHQLRRSLVGGQDRGRRLGGSRRWWRAPGDCRTRHEQHCFLRGCKKPIIYGSTEPRITFSAFLFGSTHFALRAAVGGPSARR